MFGSSPNTYPGRDELAHYISKQINKVQATALDAPIEDDEILSMLKSMKNNSPGLDGFNVKKILHCWNIIGGDFTAAVHYFFNSGHLPHGINATAIALIPKIENPTSMSDFRPIACCNTIYKCISKILANRLKTVLPYLIDRTLSAFVPGEALVITFCWHS